MPFADLRDWIEHLRRAGELAEIDAEVDPHLEVTEIVDRVVKSGGPALLFKNVRGSRMPLLINQFGTERRTCMAFGVGRLDELGERVAGVLEMTPPESIGAKLRALVGPDYPLIATVPRPSPKRWFPFAEATAAFDAIAPMVYWQNRDPATDVAGAIAALAPFGKPVLPVGQAYDGGPEGGPAGPPPKDALVRFMNTATAKGALGVSFWVWQTATAEHWAAIAEAVQWHLPAGDPKNRSQVAYLQRVLTLLGRPTAADGILGPDTRAGLSFVQQRLGLPGTGVLDAPTVHSILRPRS
jgi:hypothetical protein